MTPATLHREAPARPKTFPVTEIFGPTIQGEGAEAGLACHFIRLGGCDFRCSWCDTMYAVDPATVRATARKLAVEDIATEIDGLDGNPSWIILSGGNPALHELGPLVEALQDRAYQVAVETQGSVWRPWLEQVDRLTISPKPPSSGMATAAHASQFEEFMDRALTRAEGSSVLKIVCFDEADLDWATAVAGRWPQLPLYLSAGTPVPATGPIREAVGERYRWLCETVALIPELAAARVLPQLHVIAWKDATGV